MKAIFLFIGLSLLMSCENDDNLRRNPNLLNINVNYEVNLNLPQFNNLNFSGNSVYIPGQGNQGLIIVNSGSSYLAWDAADPNLVPSDCSRLIIDGLNAESTCDKPPNSYSLITGQPLVEDLRYPLFAYRITESGGVLRIFN
jgi:nitrite reductase/ring-hydroxylating ferredoxin subunit